MIILDTDHISSLQHRDSPKAFALQTRLEHVPPSEIAATVISVEEQTRGWLRLIRRYLDVHRQVDYYNRLLGLFEFYENWRVLPFDHDAAAKFDWLRKQRVHIGSMDLKIAAIALVNDGTLLSTNLRDYQRVPGLRVEDWLAT